MRYVTVITTALISAVFFAHVGYAVGVVVGHELANRVERRRK